VYTTVVKLNIICCDAVHWVTARAKTISETVDENINTVYISFIICSFSFCWMHVKVDNEGLMSHDHQVVYLLKAKTFFSFE